MTDLEREYSPSSRAGGSADPHVARYRAEGEAAAAGFGSRLTRTAGGSLAVPGAPGGPLLVAVHGGYWQLMAALDALYLALPVVDLGWSFASLEYTIAPAGTIPGMVAECTRELAAVSAAVTAANGGHGPVLLAGHSAGAHLAAMVALVEEPPVEVARVVLVSGVYDLRPLLQTTVNEPLGMDAGSAEARSPQLLHVRGRAETLVTWGDADTDAFKAQSRAYAAHLRSSGLASVIELECSGRHHFDVLDDVVDLSTTLGMLALGEL